MFSTSDPVRGVRRAGLGAALNVVTDNDGGNGSPQTTVGVALGSNLCGTTVGCP